MTNAFAVGINIVLVGVLVTAFLLSGRLLGPRGRREGDADVPYESGMRPLEGPGRGMSVLYWRFAVLFVVFDVDLAFLLPWALNRQGFDLNMLAAATVFCGLVAFMLAYFWRKGALECR